MTDDISKGTTPLLSIRSSTGFLEASGEHDGYLGGWLMWHVCLLPRALRITETSLFCVVARAQGNTQAARGHRRH